MLELVAHIVDIKSKNNVAHGQNRVERSERSMSASNGMEWCSYFGGFTIVYGIRFSYKFM